MTTQRALEKRLLGNSTLEITTVGIGAWAMGGGGWKFGWGEQDDSDSIAAIRHAIELGINWIDTAAVYGFGHSEEVVAHALRGIKSDDRPYVFTKCGLVPDGSGGTNENITASSIRAECEASLRRLNVETIDLYQIHWPTDDIVDIDEGWGTMAALQREGKVRYIGVSNFNVDELQRAEAIAPVTSLQPPYSAITRDIEDSILPYCADHNIGVIVYAPMASGLLTGKMTRERIAALPSNDWRSRSPRFQEPKLSQNLEVAELLRKIGESHGKSAGEVAIAWTLRQPAVTGAIVGARNSEQVDGWIGAASFRLNPYEIAQIDGATASLL